MTSLHKKAQLAEEQRFWDFERRMETVKEVLKMPH